MLTKHFAPVLWIRICFSADVDPDPAFYLYADPNSDPGQTSKSQKVEFLHWKYTKLGKVIDQNTYIRRFGTKAFLKWKKPGLFFNFCQLPCSWIWIWVRIPKTDPDPLQQKECGFMWIWIHNTALHTKNISTILYILQAKHADISHEASGAGQPSGDVQKG
jgi:hypothetical protein